MTLKIHSVENGKTVNAEKVWLDVVESTNLTGYALVDRTFTSTGQLSNEFRHIFVFPSLQVAKNDYVCLNSGTGDYKALKNSRGGMTHFFYWGSGNCVWNNNGGDRATLIKYSVISGMDVQAAT